MRQLLTASQILVGPANTRIYDGAVLIDDDHVVDVGPRRYLDANVSPEVQRRAFPEHTLLPGLIDAHVHLVFDTTPNFLDTVQRVDDAALLVGMATRAQQALASGITTLRDLGDRRGIALQLQHAVRSGQWGGPRILAAGAPLTIPQGHCWFLGGEVAGEDAIRQRVRQHAAHGVNLIKVMASGGHITPHSPPPWQCQFTTDELRALVAEATAAGLPVAAHAHGTDAILAATDAGVSTIEHCSWQTAHGFDRRDEAAKQMADLGIAACSASGGAYWKQRLAELTPDQFNERFGRLSWLDQLGVTLIVGTDAGLPGVVFNDLVGALELYDYLGFPHDRILDMATTTSATTLGIGDHVGTLQPGYSADLLVVRGDPLTDLQALRHPALVLARGKEYRASNP